MRPSLMKVPLVVVLRVVAALLFAEHGAAKVLGLFAGFGGPGQVAPVLSEMWFAGQCELVGGLLLALGMFTRPVAFLLSGEMAIAYFQVHFPRGFWPIENGGELTVLYCFLFLTFAKLGDDGLGVDTLLRRRRSVPVKSNSSTH